MLAFESLIAQAATDAGMKTPPGELLDEEWSAEEYPHFRVFCNIQLGREMSRPNQHWDNAKVIAKIPDDRIKEMTLADLEAAGVELS